jgi:hypothetical protein
VGFSGWVNVKARLWTAEVIKFYFGTDGKPNAVKDEQISYI